MSGISGDPFSAPYSVNHGPVAVGSGCATPLLAVTPYPAAGGQRRSGGQRSGGQGGLCQGYHLERTKLPRMDSLFMQSFWVVLGSWQIGW